MAINSVSLYNVYQQKGVNPVSQTSIQGVNQNPLIGFQQNQNQGDVFVKSQNNNLVETPSGKKVSQEEKDKMLSRQDEVRRHEQAHQAAGGSLAGAPSYEYNEYGYIQNGHVNISVPGVNEANPEQSKSQAEIVKRSALAPSGFSELSSADLSVAAKAESVISQSEDLINEKNAQKDNEQKEQGSGEKNVSTNPFA